MKFTPINSEDGVNLVNLDQVRLISIDTKDNYVGFLLDHGIEASLKLDSHEDLKKLLTKIPTI